MLKKTALLVEGGFPYGVCFAVFPPAAVKLDLQTWGKRALDNKMIFLVVQLHCALRALCVKHIMCPLQ